MEPWSISHKCNFKKKIIINVVFWILYDFHISQFTSKINLNAYFSNEAHQISNDSNYIVQIVTKCTDFMNWKNGLLRNRH